MKNNKFIKISVLILTLSLCVGMLVPFSVSAETTAETETKPEIISQNVQYSEKFSLMYAVAADTAAAPVTLYLYDADPVTGAEPVRTYVEDEVTAATGNLAEDSYVFITEGVAAYAMAKDFYVQAVDADGKQSDVKKYSVGLYLYERLAASDATAEQKNFYNATLNFGASAQKVILKETDESKYINNYCYVTSIDGTTVNGFGSDIFPKGSTVTLAKEGAEKLTAIAYDADGGYIPKITADSYTIPTDAVSVEVSAGNRIIYRDQRKTFDDLAIGDTSSFIAGNLDTDNNLGVVDTEDHGKVYSVRFDQASDHIYQWSPSTKLVTKDKATAVEFSFDIKVSFDSTANTSTNPYFTLLDQKYNGSASAFRTNAFFAKGYLELKDARTNKAAAAYTDIQLDEWFHVRGVCYEGDPTMYVYVNGSDVPLANNVLDSGSTYVGEVSTLGFGRISALDANGAGFTIQIDNFFYGFTMDKNPNAQ